MSHDCWEGDLLKETMMADERLWKGPGMTALTSTKPKSYLFVCARKTKAHSLTPEWITHQDGRWGGSSRVNEGMGANRPSVEALKPDHGQGNSFHMQSCREKGKRGSVVGGGGRAGATGIAEGEPKELWKYRESWTEEKGSNLCPWLSLSWKQETESQSIVV
jgi:hypothetical protein